MIEFDSDHLRRATDDFSPSRLIGKGSHGSVYRANLDTGQILAVKTPSLGLQTLHDNSKLQNEITVLSSLPTPHPNIVNLIGRASFTDKNHKTVIIMAMEFFPNGSLHDLLHLSDKTPSPFLTNWEKRIHVATQIARGVKFLHESNPTVIHRDVKSANVLFDSEWNAKLADFGLSVLRKDEGGELDSVCQPAGTMGYLDPSYTEPCKLSTKNDVFSFGVVLLEILCCRRAIDVSRSPAFIADWARQLMDDEEARLEEFVCDKSVAIPTYIRNAIRNLLRVAIRCVSTNEGDRPIIGEVLVELESSSVVIERFRFPIWINFLKVIIVLKKENRRAAIKRRSVSPIVATSVVVDALDQPTVPRRKLLRELLDDAAII